jgi:hypothetical protein
VDELTTTTTWRPLSVREAGATSIEQYDALHDGVPEWLSEPLAEWVRHALNDRQAGELALRLRIAVSEARDELHGLVLDNDESSLDIIDGALNIIARDLDADLAVEIAGDLETVLECGGSAWTFGVTPDDRLCLQRRVDETVAGRFATSTSTNSNAARHLRHAWHELYGRDGSPSEAFNQAVKAVEAAAIPVVASPKKARPTLGTELPEMLQKPDKWQLSLTGRGNEQDGIEVVIDMMKLLWTSHRDRHGTPNEVSEVTREEAEAAVHLALTLVHWFETGLVARRE